MKPDRIAFAAIVVLICAALQSASCAAAETPATDLVLGDAGTIGGVPSVGVYCTVYDKAPRRSRRGLATR